MSEVMLRVPLDLGKALLEDNGATLIAAARRCGRCDFAAACDAWIRDHDESALHDVPDFCPNAALMRSFRPVSV